MDVAVNPNEVKSFRYVSKDELKAFLASAGTDTCPCPSQPDRDGLPVTPWFRLVVEKYFACSACSLLQLLVQMVGHARTAIIGRRPSENLPHVNASRASPIIFI